MPWCVVVYHLSEVPLSNWLRMLCKASRVMVTCIGNEKKSLHLFEHELILSYEELEGALAAINGTSIEQGEGARVKHLGHSVHGECTTL